MLQSAHMKQRPTEIEREAVLPLKESELNLEETLTAIVTWLRKNCYSQFSYDYPEFSLIPATHPQITKTEDKDFFGRSTSSFPNEADRLTSIQKWGPYSLWIEAHDDKYLVMYTTTYKPAPKPQVVEEPVYYYGHGNEE